MIVAWSSRLEELSGSSMVVIVKHRSIGDQYAEDF